MSMMYLLLFYRCSILYFFVTLQWCALLASEEVSFIKDRIFHNNFRRSLGVPDFILKVKTSGVGV